MEKGEIKFRLSLLIVVAVVAIGLGASFLIAPIGWAPYHTVAIQGEPAQGLAQGSKLNVNTATVQQLMCLDGLGEKKAQAIRDYIEANGNFAVLDDMVAVDGISQKMIDSWQAVACAK